MGELWSIRDLQKIKISKMPPNVRFIKKGVKPESDQGTVQDHIVLGERDLPLGYKPVEKCKPDKPSHDIVMPNPPETEVMENKSDTIKSNSSSITVPPYIMMQEEVNYMTSAEKVIVTSWNSSINYLSKIGQGLTSSVVPFGGSMRVWDTILAQRAE